MRALYASLLTAVVALVGAPAPAVGQTALPTLRIDAPVSLEAVAERVGRFPISRLTTAMTLAGLTRAGLGQKVQVQICKISVVTR